MIAEIALIFVVLFIGSFIQGASGFGFGLFSMSFLPFMFTVKDSTLLITSLALVTCITIFIKVYKHIDVKKLIYLLSAAVIGRIVAFFVLHHFGEMDILKKVLGFVLIGMVIYILFQKRIESREKSENVVLPLSLGFLGGFIGGVFVVGGPFFVFYYLMACKDKYSYNANLQATFIVAGIFTMAMHGFSGDLHREFFIYFVIGVISVIVGSRLGMKWFEYLSQERIRKIASVIVALAGLNLIFFS
ncbi:sulfite exporter TauE/SafE family protein [Salibacterium salarium]|uniref:Probable membrane transporter protein n=1 Tax=Salibacterium salarium TaxID=284579 RepID=A0A428N3N0_9BACI|nr:sulfite exporter TauE/SafE family protein [Salibacterium salarium]RSL33053.1 sulfite exporter TauE/SafE family protein [Salibacterium salarium]